MEEALSWDRVEELALDFRLEKDSTFQKTVVLPRSRNPEIHGQPPPGRRGLDLRRRAHGPVG